MSVTKKLVTGTFGVESAKALVNSFANGDVYYACFGKSLPYGILPEYLEGVDGYSFSAKTDVASNKLLVPNSVFADGELVRYQTDFFPINGLNAGSTYYVVEKDSAGFKLSLTLGGPAISITAKNTEELHVIRYASGKNIDTVTGDDIETPQDSELYKKTRLYDDMIFSKRVLQQDVMPMAKKHAWESGQVYFQYDHTDWSLNEKPFYVVVDDITEFNVYKCLFNNYGATSQIPPSRLGNESDLNPIATSDGYVWKYLYTLSKSEYEKFSTSNYMPVKENSEVKNSAVGGTIEVVSVISSGFGYTNTLRSTLKSDDIRYSGLNTAYGVDDSASSINGFYENCVLKIVSSDTPGVVGQYRKILSYFGTGAKKYVVLDSPFTITPSVNDTYEISPLVEIWGDGNESRIAVGRAIVENLSVSSIEILDSGAGYRNAVTNIRVPASVSSNTGFRAAKLNAIVSPSYGHGGHIFDELNASAVCFALTLDKSESGQIPAENDFRTLALVKNPKFTGLRVALRNSSNFSLGETVIQAKAVKLFGTVEVTTGSNLVSKKNNGEISNIVTFRTDDNGNPLRGTGYDHRLNPNLVFDNRGTGGRNAAGVFTANTSYTKSLSFRSNNSVQNTVIGGMAGHNFAVGERVRYDVDSVLSDTPIFGLSAGQYYFVVANTANSISVSTSQSGSPLVLSNSRDFIYNIAANTTVISGSDSRGANLAHTGNVSVIVNTTTLPNTSYTVTNSSVITLNSNATPGSVVTVRAFTNSVSNSIFGVVNGSIVSTSITNRGSGYRVAPSVIPNETSGGSGASLVVSLENTEVTAFKDSLEIGDYVHITDGSSSFVSKVKSVTNDFSFTVEDTCTFTSNQCTVSVLKVVASGTVRNITSGFLNLNGVSGVFQDDLTVFGLRSYAFSRAVESSSVTINDRSTNFNYMLNLTTFVGNLSSNTLFIDDERIYQNDDNDFSRPRAHVHSVVENNGVNNDLVYATRPYGIFSREVGDRTIYGDQSQSNFDLLNVYPGDFELNSGEILYIENIDPINRNSNQREQIKVLIEY